MPTFTRGDVSIHYEEHGEGFPVLLFAPGGMRSAIPLWERAPFHPVRELSDRFRVISMDQRNAGQSRAPVRGTDGWHTYREDHLALLDELGVPRCAVLGMCIGGAFCLSIAVAAPERVVAAVVEQPIGFSGTNRGAFREIVDSWASDLMKSRPDVTAEAVEGLWRNLYEKDFVFAVSRDEVRKCPVPLLVLKGNDMYHPAAISEEVARLAPRAELVERWKEGDAVGRARDRVREFLSSHTRG
jgi:pimeloyl-ACP methyl ester carboxylesterase